MGTMAMMGTPYGSDIGISPGSMPWNAPGSCPGSGWCACGGAMGDGGAPLSCGCAGAEGVLPVAGEAACAGTVPGAASAEAVAAGTDPGCDPLVLAPLPAFRRSTINAFVQTMLYDSSYHARILSAMAGYPLNQLAASDSIGV